MQPPLLSIQDLSVSFCTDLGLVRAVRRVSFELFQGETVALVGESGCGKSATAQAILQLHNPTTTIVEQGKICFEGHSLIGSSQAALQQIRGKHIGMIFQDPMGSLNPTLRIGKQITESLRRHLHMNRLEARVHALNLLKLVELSDPAKCLEQYPYQLSGGMRQRVMIAIAIACSPKLLIADEPTTALDVTVQAQILHLLKMLQKKIGMTILLITHDLGIVSHFCERLLVMYGGEIIETGTVNNIFQNPQHPYTQGLLASIPRLDQDPKKPLDSIQGTPPSLLSLPPGCPFYPRCKRKISICQITAPPLITQLDSSIRCWKANSL